MENTVNERVRLLRNQLGLTQNDFATKIDSTLATISRTENGGTNPQQKMINRIIEVFSVNRDWILHGKGEMFTENVVKATNRESVNPWENALVKELKEEVTFLRELLKNMTLPQANRANPNFNTGTEVAGFFQEKLISSVRAVA